jgi:hypothetical protein
MIAAREYERRAFCDVRTNGDASKRRRVFAMGMKRVAMAMKHEERACTRSFVRRNSHRNIRS